MCRHACKVSGGPGESIPELRIPLFTINVFEWRLMVGTTYLILEWNPLLKIAGSAPGALSRVYMTAMAFLKGVVEENGQSDTLFKKIQQKRAIQLRMKWRMC